MAGSSRSIEQLQSEAEGRVRAVLRGLGPLGLLGPLSSGNVSSMIDIYANPDIVITQKGQKLDDVNAELAVARWSLVPKVGTPSTELPLHKTIYHQRSAKVVAHLHSPCATAVSCWFLHEFPLIHYHQALLGSVPTPMVSFAVPGSQDLTEQVVATLEPLAEARLYSLMLRNHGIVVWGQTAADVLKRAEVLEDVCRIILSAPGPAHLNRIHSGHWPAIEEMFEAYTS